MMFGFGSSQDKIVSVSGRAFMRAQPMRGRMRYWLASIPLLAVTAVTLNGPAPAEISIEGAPRPVAAAEQQSRWSVADVQQLVTLIEESAQEGLDPTRYKLAALRMALSGGAAGQALDTLATSAALSLAHDYANGRIEDKAALDWHLGTPIDSNQLAAELDNALQAGKFSGWLRGLLPSGEQYKALRAAYAAADPADVATRERLRANLERWRWMPRTLGERYIYVNVPSYRLELMNGGVEEASYNVIVGAPKTPTPQLALMAQSVVANPGWNLPPSVLKEGGWQRKGYKVSRRADGSLSVYQAPGPRNPLGRIKIDMPNAHAIYLHDTPNKAAFGRTDRALSHGCVRVENIAELATLLRDGSALDEALFDERTTKVLQLEKSVPVYIVYFTAEAQPDGSIRFLDDPYHRDDAVMAQMGGSNASSLQLAAR